MQTHHNQSISHKKLTVASVNTTHNT